MTAANFLTLVAAGMFLAAAVIIGAGHVAEVIHHEANATYAY